MNDLAGKCALITGSTSGIGAALARRLADLGASVAINYHLGSQAGAAEKLVQEINAKSDAIAVKGDASTILGVDHLVKTVVDTFQKIDILVCMAGVSAMKDLASTTEADFDTSYAVNVKGPYFLAKVWMLHVNQSFSIC